MEFIEYRTIEPTDFHTLLFEGSYVVIPDLMKEVSEYPGCTVPGLSKMTQVRSTSDKRGSTVEIDLSKLSSTPVNTVLVHKSYPATATRAALLKILLTIPVREKQPWFTQFFNRIRSSKGFLLLVPTSRCLAHCLAVAFIYLDEMQVKCCMLNQKGYSGTPFQLATIE